MELPLMQNSKSVAALRPEEMMYSHTSSVSSRSSCPPFAETVDEKPFRRRPWKDALPRPSPDVERLDSVEPRRETWDRGFARLPERARVLPLRRERLGGIT